MDQGGGKRLGQGNGEGWARVVARADHGSEHGWARAVRNGRPGLWKGVY